MHRKREAQEVKEEAARKATVNARTQKMRIELGRQVCNVSYASLYMQRACEPTITNTATPS